jgi:hypothetical protein
LIVSVSKDTDLKLLLASRQKPVFVVEQANDKPYAKQSSFGRVVGNKVLAFVPACVSTVTSQTPEKDFIALATCYENTILAAFGAGAKTIVVNQLGVGKKVNITYSGGKENGYDIWGNLFWTVSKTSYAARLAVMAADLKVTPDISVVFSVPAEAYNEWDSVLTF